MVYKVFELKDGRKVECDWLKEADLPEVVEALSNVMRARHTEASNELEKFAALSLLAEAHAC
jgi:hypothetical protein